MKPRWRVVPSVLMAALSGCGGAGGQSEEPTSFQEAVDGFVIAAMDELGVVPGLSMAVVANGRVVHERGYGFADVEARRPVTPETVFYTASLAKAFTGMTAAVLAARGELDLDRPILDFFPGLSTQAPVRGDRVRVRDLLSHSKGFTNGGINFLTTFVGPPSEADLIRVLNDYSAAAPGFVYSNTNFALAGEVIERATGDPWQDVMDRSVFEPLGMDRSTAWASRVDPATAARPYLAEADGIRSIEFPKTDATITGAGGIFSTAHDLARFVIANLQEGRLEGRQAIPPGAVREAHAPQAELEARFFEFDRFAYGLGFYRARWGDELLIHHFGGYPGFRSHLSFMPDREIGVVVLQNEGVDGNRFADIVAAYAYDMMLGRDADAAGARRLAELRDQIEQRRAARSGWDSEIRGLDASPGRAARPLTDYTGAYRNERLGILRVVEGAPGLRIDFGDLDGRLLPAGGNEFVVDWFFNLMTFNPARFVFEVEDARVTGFDWGGRPFRRVPGG